MKEKFNPLIKTAEKKEKRGFFDRLTRKKKKPPELQIEVSIKSKGNVCCMIGRLF